LEQVPDFTTLQKEADRSLRSEQASRLLDMTMRLGKFVGKLPPMAPLAAMDRIQRILVRARSDLFGRGRYPRKTIGIAELPSRDVHNLLSVPVEVSQTLKNRRQNRFLKALNAKRFQELRISRSAKNLIGPAHCGRKSLTQLRFW